MSREPTFGDFAALGLHPGADAEEIRAAYRRLVKVHHPDRNPGDAAALETFQRITDSYAALRAHAQARVRPERSPLSAAMARRRSSRRGGTAQPIGVADLAVGAAVWVDAGAILVGPDRAATLEPAAVGGAFPSAAHVIRIERRADGFHVFMPPQPSARWPISTAAESDGLAVAALWVGDREDDDGGGPGGARVPLRLLGDRIGEMVAGERGWAAAETLAVDVEGAWAINAAQPIGHEPHRATPLRVICDEDGYRVQSEMAAEEWAPVDAHADGWVPIAVALLAGVTYPAAIPPLT